MIFSIVTYRPKIKGKKNTIYRVASRRNKPVINKNYVQAGKKVRVKKF